MHHNGTGLYVDEHAVVDLYGKNTDIHSNMEYGIEAEYHGKVQIHLPSQHNTSHDNVQNLLAYSDGTITNVKWLNIQSSESGSGQVVVNIYKIKLQQENNTVYILVHVFIQIFAK